MAAGEMRKLGRRHRYPWNSDFDGDADALVHRMTVLKSPQTAKASADAAWERVVPQNPPRPSFGSERGSIDIHDVHLRTFFKVHTRLARTSIANQLHEITFKRRALTARVIATNHGHESIV
eukprot:4400539-Pleurochrysis_carterae.AAC.1